MKSIFPSSMMEPKGISSIEDIASRLSYFIEQLHLYHLQTNSYAEHKALDSMYSFVIGFKDGVLEKIMGYEGKKLRAYNIAQLKDYAQGCCSSLVREVMMFSEELCQYAKAKNMPDVDNMAQELSGSAGETLYLLTLS